MAEGSSGPPCSRELPSSSGPSAQHSPKLGSASWAPNCGPKALNPEMTPNPNHGSLQITEAGPPGPPLLLGLALSSCGLVLSLITPSPRWPQEPLPLTCISPSLRKPSPQGRRPPLSIPLQARADGWAASWAPRGLCSQAHTTTPTATMARHRSVSACSSP